MNKLTESDLFFLNKAVELAALPLGAVSPNPYVGAVIVKDGKIIGEGFHAKAGTAHAEVVAIANATESTIGATIYVSLEPCCHHGKTGPCTEAILKAGITKVVYATQDPNPSVAGKGDAFLQRNGIESICGNLESARTINKIFFHNQQSQAPFVTLKAAMSLDGKIASKTGDSQWITGPEARIKGHELRAAHDAILIGKKTLLNDNPSLTVRVPDKAYPNPVRILLLRNFGGISHTNYALFDTAAAPTWIVYPAKYAPKAELAEALQQKNVRLMPMNGDVISTQDLLAHLYDEKIMSVLLEGGSSIYNAFLNENSVNECAFFYGPRLIGDHNAPSIWDHSNITKLSSAPILNIQDTKQLGNSIYVRATFEGAK